MEEDIEDDPFIGMEHTFPGDVAGDDECFYKRDDHKEAVLLHCNRDFNRYMDSSSNPDGGSQDSPPQENKKKIRGICKMKHVTQSRKAGMKLKIGWNSRGQPIDPNKSTFSYYVGWITRSTVPIIYSDWGEVPLELKNHIWEQVQESFEVTEEHKNFILSLAGRDARAFRSRLRKKFLMDDDGNLILQPPEKYARLNTVANYWMDFVNQSSTEDFKKESKENAEKAKRMTLRYRRSAKGYAQLEQDMIASSGSYVTSLPRYAMWKAARLNKNGIIDDEEENLTQTIPQEKLQTMGKDDILSRALGVPEHPGRVRAAGFGVSQKSIFGQTQSTPQTEWQHKVQQWMTHITQWLSHISGGQVPPFMPMPGQPPFMPMPGQPPFMPMLSQPPMPMPSQPPFMHMPGQPPCMPMPGQPPSMSTAGQPPSMSAAGQPPSTPVVDQPASTPAADQPASTPAAGQPPCMPMPGQPPSMSTAGQPPSMSAAGQPPSTPAVDQPASTPAAGQPHPTPAAGQPHSMPATTHTVPPVPIPRQSHPRADAPPHPQPSIQPQSQRGSCTPITSSKIPEGDHPCFLFLNFPHRHVARGIVYKKEGGVTLHTKSLPPDHYKVSIDIVQSHEEGSPLPVPIEDENLMTLRDAIGTYVAWPRSLIHLAPQGPPPSSKGKGKEHFRTKESVTSPMKGSVQRIIPEEFAGAEGLLAFNSLKVMVRGNNTLYVVENTYCKDYWGKEFTDKIGKDEIKEVVCHRVLSASSLCYYISYLCEAYLHDTDKASKFSFISPYELEEEDVNGYIVEALQRHANQDHLVMVPCNVGAIITYRTNKGVKVSRAKMNQTNWVNVQCPKQMNTIDCGYYVGLFIGDILQHGQTRIPINYFPKSRCPTFPDSRIQQFIREWCTYIYLKFLEVQLSPIHS
ncbi:Papain-like cysteine peptidase superfamily [Sesbania bispinosa]|nr:Papain-like cysteine peptidase superfamily [Sesbania bispinosa]